MMTADFARELRKGSMRSKGPWFKLRLSWFCGRLNSKIESRAEHGYRTCKINTESQNTARQYFKIMAQMYEDLGYIVIYNYDKAPYDFVVCWDFKELPFTQQRKYFNYDYITSCPETENE